MKLCLVTVVTLVALTPVLLVSAQTPPCGNIITPVDFKYEGSAEFSDPISDCGNPLGRTGDLTTFQLNNQIITNNSTISVSATGTTSYQVGNENYFVSSGANYYKHNGQDLVRVKTDFSEPTRSDVEQSIRTYFSGNEAQTQKYTDIYFDNDRYSLFYDNFYQTFYFDSVANDFVWRVFALVDSHVLQTVRSARPALLPGTYTVAYIDTNEGGGPNPTFEPSLIDRVFATLIPTAEAYYYVNTVTFTLQGSTPEPAGASSVLFLPGIQASRLYLGDGVQVSDKLWEPGNNTDVRLLGMDTNGTSNLDIRTNDVVDEIGTSFLGLGGNVYKGFISFMNKLVNDDKVIKRWTPFAYDWRNDVFDVVSNGTKYRDGSIRNPVDEVINLAGDSFSKKVTIVAHSNGGLLAKAIMIELERRGKQDLVDKIIFIGTPQLGTPKAIATILHGYDQEALGGLVIDDGVAREVIKNLPGTYSLLPSDKYLETTSDSLIEFDNSESTASLRNSYGNSISDIGELNAFMAGIEDPSGRSSVSVSEVNKPTNVNSTLYFNAQSKHKLKLDNWIPASTTQVFQIVGTGLPTMKSLRYREILENVCAPGPIGGVQCLPKKIMRPQAVMTAYGDETVVSKSSSNSNGNINLIYFDLNKVENERLPIFGTKFSHTNLTEYLRLQDLLLNVFNKGTTREDDYFKANEPIFSKSYDIEEINSPVKISTKDSEGRITGVVLEGNQWMPKTEIPNSSYFEFGGTKYLIVPSALDRTTTLVGESAGAYTLSLSELNSADVQQIKHEVVNATTTATMVAKYEKRNGLFSTIKSDYDNNGTIDRENTVDGILVIPPPLYTYQSLKSTITLLPIKKLHKDVLLLLVNQAEQFSKSTTSQTFIKLRKLTLKLLESTVILYQNQKILTGVQANELLKIIRFLNQ